MYLKILLREIHSLWSSIVTRIEYYSHYAYPPRFPSHQQLKAPQTLCVQMKSGDMVSQNPEGIQTTNQPKG